jgi:hypothetical protein
MKPILAFFISMACMYFVAVDAGAQEEHYVVNKQGELLSGKRIRISQMFGKSPVITLVEFNGEKQKFQLEELHSFRTTFENDQFRTVKIMEVIQKDGSIALSLMQPAYLGAMDLYYTIMDDPPHLSYLKSSFFTGFFQRKQYKKHILPQLKSCDHLVEKFTKKKFWKYNWHSMMIRAYNEFCVEVL